MSMRLHINVNYSFQKMSIILVVRQSFMFYENSITIVSCIFEVCALAAWKEDGVTTGDAKEVQKRVWK